MDLSIVIPAYEESEKIVHDVREAAEFLAGNHLTGQIIVVDDGSTDDTAAVAKNALSDPHEGVSLEVIRYPEHKGKGYAVRTGIASATGDFVMFADSGSCVPYEEVLHGLKMIKDDECDIAHASRRVDGCRVDYSQAFHRRICSNLFRSCILWLMGIPSDLTDTQCGFKIYRGTIARRLYREAVTDGSAFDIEIILRARRAGYRIKEFPVRWTCDPDSRLSVVKSVWYIPRELWQMKMALRHEHRNRSDTAPATYR
ncbi:MAG: glycosyltransferase [Phycisphaerales bacterium]|nr:MAG: glycosyltransferase [Phycisphaerales bacterium]